jgi:hypothetical protein
MKVFLLHICLPVATSLPYHDGGRCTAPRSKDHLLSIMSQVARSLPISSNQTMVIQTSAQNFEVRSTFGTLFCTEINPVHNNDKENDTNDADKDYNFDLSAAQYSTVQAYL